MPAGFDTLCDQDVGPGRDSFARRGDIGDLRENERTRTARLRKELAVDAPRERDGRRALGQRDRESLALVEREDEVDAERCLVELRSNALQLFAKLLRFGPRSRQRAEAPCGGHRRDERRRRRRADRRLHHRELPRNAHGDERTPIRT